MLIDEGLHDFKRRPSSAWAKNALASFRISLARRNSRTSRSSSLTRCCSLVVGPSRAPLSRSPWRTQRRSVSAVQPILPAIDSMAAHCDGYWSLASNTMRTARSTTSGETFGNFLIMAPSSQSKEPPQIPGRFTLVPSDINALGPVQMTKTGREFQQTANPRNRRQKRYRSIHIESPGWRQTE
jgi:hypothetical protein